MDSRRGIRAIPELMNAQQNVMRRNRQPWVSLVESDGSILVDSSVAEALDLIPGGVFEVLSGHRNLCLRPAGNEDDSEDDLMLADGQISGLVKIQDSGELVINAVYTQGLGLAASSRFEIWRGHKCQHLNFVQISSDDINEDIRTGDSLPKMTLSEEFEVFLKDALYDADVDQNDVLSAFSDAHLGLYFCDETEKEVMRVVCEEPFILNSFLDEV